MPTEMIDIGEIIFEFFASGFKRISRPKRLKFADITYEAALNHIFYQICTTDPDSSGLLDEVLSGFKDRSTIDLKKLRDMIVQCQMVKTDITKRVLSKFVMNGVIAGKLTLRAINRGVDSIVSQEYSWLSNVNRKLISDLCKNEMI